MRTLVVYYSLEGSTKCIAETVAEMTGADVERLRTKERITASKFMDHYWSGTKEHPNEKIELEPLVHDPNEYDMIFIGTPVWAWSPAPPIYSFLKDNPVKGKKIALFLSSEGERGKTFERMTSLLEGNSILSREEFVDPRKDGEGSCELKAGNWAKALLKETFSN